MKNKYELISNRFSTELNAIEKVLENSKDFSGKPQFVVCDSVHMLLVAKFDEFVRQMAIEAMGQKLVNSKENQKFPAKMFGIIWNDLTENELKKLKDNNPKGRATYSVDQVRNLSKETKIEIDKIIEYSVGKNNYNKFIFKIIDTNQHMYYSNINKLFKFCSIDICSEVCEYQEMVAFFSKPLKNQTVAGQFETELDEFIRHRNRIAHALVQENPLHPDVLLKKIELFKTFANALTRVICRKRSLRPKPF